MEKHVEMLPLDVRRGKGKGRPTDRLRLTTYERFLEKFVQALPQSAAVDVNDLKKRGLAEGLALFYIVFYLTVLLYLLYTGAQSEQNREYLSVVAPSASTAICKQIPVPITGTFLADSSGRWSTDPSYDAASPIYSITLSGTSVTEDQFATVMRDLSNQVKNLGQKMKSYDVIRSRVAWSFFTIGDDSAKVTFQPNALLQEMLTFVYPGGTPVFSSVRGVCQPAAVIPPPTYNYYSNSLKINFPYEPAPTAAPTSAPTPYLPIPTQKPTSKPTATPMTSSEESGRVPKFEFCPEQLSVKNETFDLGGTKDTSTAEFDVVQLALAFALNFGITETTFLSKIYSKTTPDGMIIEVWVHKSYPDMRPVTCSTAKGKPRVCYAEWGRYPVFTSRNRLRACECPRDLRDYYCNGGIGQPMPFEFMQIELLFPTNEADSYGPFLTSMQRLQQIMIDDPVRGPNKVQRLVSGLAFNALHFGSSARYYEYWRANYYGDNGDRWSYASFTGNFTSLGTSVSMMSMDLNIEGPLNSDGVSLAKLSSSSFNVSEPNAPPGSPPVPVKGLMCQDSLYRAEALERMATNPPVKLVQPYLSCHATPLQAIITSAGLAAANAALLTTIILTLAISTAVFYFNEFKRDQKIIPPARKALMREEAEDRLMSNVERLSAENRTLFAEVAYLKARLNPASVVYSPPMATAGERGSTSVPSLPGPDMHDSILDRHAFGGAYERQTMRMSHDNPMYQPGDGATLFRQEPTRTPQRLSSNEGLQQAIFSQGARFAPASDRLSHGSR